MATEKLDLQEGTRLVHPGMGVCTVVGKSEMTIGGQTATFLRLAGSDGSTVMIPLAKLQKAGVRRLAGREELARFVKELAAAAAGPDLNWKTRQKDHGALLAEGDILSLLKIVRELGALADLRPLPAKERALFADAKDRLVRELGAAAGIPEAHAEDAIDRALYPPDVDRKRLAQAMAAMRGAPEDDLDGDDLGEELDDEEITSLLLDGDDDGARDDLLADAGTLDDVERGEGEGGEEGAQAGPDLERRGMLDADVLRREEASAGRQEEAEAADEFAGLTPMGLGPKPSVKAVKSAKPAKAAKASKPVEKEAAPAGKQAPKKPAVKKPKAASPKTAKSSAKAGASPKAAAGTKPKKAVKPKKTAAPKKVSAKRS